MQKAKEIAVFTGTRADYGLLSTLMRGIADDAGLNLQVIVSGTHLSPGFGSTVNLIREDGFYVDAAVEMVVSSDTGVGVAKSFGLGVLGYVDALARLKPDYLIVLGDRYEALAITQAAFLMKIRVVHLHGGEMTSGALDDSMRHAITKLSVVHITSNEVHRNRVIQLGENPDTVFNFGAIGLDFIKQSSFPSCADFKKKLRVNWSEPIFVVTYHPATVGDENPEETFKSLLAALDYFPKYRIIMTYPNADEGSHGLISLAKRYSNLQGNRVKLVKSMGSQLYFSALKYATLVIGNSSSGIIEAPSVGLPTVNIGSRQQGRAAAGSVVNAGTSSSEIVDGIKAGLKLRTKLNFHSLENPYGDGQTGAKIIQLLKSRDFQFKKIFFDLND